MYGKVSELSGKTEWNLDEFIAFADRFPGSLMFRNPTKTAVLDICLKANGGNIVDWNSNDTDFDRELLIKMLEFANRFMNADNYSEDSRILERISTGDIHLMTGYALPSLQEQEEIFGASTSPIGYPSETGNGYMIYAKSVAAISSKCQYTETAWEFLSILLSEEVQSGSLEGYPIRKSCLESYLEFAREDSGTTVHLTDIGISYEMCGATDAEIESFLHLMDTADTIRVYDQQIDNIVKEEASAYFSGQKSVTAIVDIIENRVGIYVKEAR
jgi:ABC-type glycerol-3-phosphate transport system substrate-binding protein